MEIRKALHRIGKRLLIDGGILGADSVADRAVDNGSELQVHALAP
jgi:hypothetical protein